jgi:hypothetical protein
MAHHLMPLLCVLTLNYILFHHIIAKSRDVIDHDQTNLFHHIHMRVLFQFYGHSINIPVPYYSFNDSFNGINEA